MRDKKTRIPLIVSLIVHVLLVLIWSATESWIARRDGEVPIVMEEDDGFVFEIIETPDFLRNEEPDAPTNLVSDRSTRAADDSPMTNEQLHVPYSPGEFIFKTYDEEESEPSEPGGEEKPDDGLGEIVAVDLMGEGDQDRHYQLESRSRDFRNLMSSLDRKGGVSFNTYEWDFAPYMLAMKRRVEKNLHPPYAFTHMGMVSGTNVLHFTVLRDGTVKNLTILGSDTHVCLDRTSVTAIELSMPFMPLPHDFPEDVLEVTAQFSYILRY